MNWAGESSTAINGVASSVTYDTAGRIITNTNALGVFNTTYDGNSFRKLSQSYPNGQTAEFGYAGNLQDQHLQRITNKLGATPISEFIYGRDVPTGQITSWSQQAGTQTPSIYSLAYDPVDQLIAASVSAGGNVVSNFSYSYDPASNRLTEQVDATTRQFSYNALNELTSVEGDAGPGATYQWDAEHRLISVTSGNENTEFTYDGLGRRVGIRFLVNGAEVSNRRFVWCDNDICEERTPDGIVSKRFFFQGMKVESGATAGDYFYSRDHLGSIRELTDSDGNVRARYSYDPFGRRTLLTGNVDADFGFAGMFWTPAASLNLTWFRAYDPAIGHWLSRDPVKDAETSQGINLFTYVRNNSVNLTDPLGLKDPDDDLSLGQWIQAAVCVYTGLFCGKPYAPSPDRGWIGGDPRPSGGGPDGGAGPNGGAPGGAAPARGMPGGGGGGGGALIGPGGLPGGPGQCRNDNNNKPPRPPCKLERGLLDMTTGLFTCQYACSDGRFTPPYKFKNACPRTRPREVFP